MYGRVYIMHARETPSRRDLILLVSLNGRPVRKTVTPSNTQQSSNVVVLSVCVWIGLYDHVSELDHSHRKQQSTKLFYTHRRRHNVSTHNGYVCVCVSRHVVCVQ